MSFLQIQQSLVTHRKTLRLARLLGVDRYTVVGRLIALWAWCLDNAPDGCLGVEPTTGTDVGLLADVMADVMGWDGPSDELEERLIEAGFLDIALDAQGNRHLHLHDWQVWVSAAPGDDAASVDGASDDVEREGEV